MKTGIFYATTAGTTKRVAELIAKDMDVDMADVFNVADTAPSRLGDYELILLGSPTYGDGDLQGDMADFLDGASMLDLTGRKVAVFGTGDESMTDTFCNAVGKIYDRIKRTGATMEGAYNTFPYEFRHSDAVPVNGAGAEGLLIDEVNRPQDTERRVAEWVRTL